MEFPTSPEMITTAWLDRTLRATGVLNGARVRSFDVRILDGEQGALSELVRLDLTYENDSQSTVPQRLFAKFAVADLDFRALLHSGGLYEREIRFYELLSSKTALPTPRCYFSAIDVETGEFLLLLEDMAPAQNGSRAAGCAPEQAELAIRNIAAFHAAWWESPQLIQLDWLRPLSLQARQAWSERYRQAWPVFVEMLPDLPPSIFETGERVGEQMMAIFERFYDHSPRTLIHNDFQLDNFFFASAAGGAPFAVIDWQLLARGCGPFDVGTFLGGNLSVEDRRVHEMALLRIYHDELVMHGVAGYSFDRCLEDYRFAMLDGIFRMVVSLGVGDMRAEQVHSHRDLIWPRYQAAILDLDVGELLPK